MKIVALSTLILLSSCSSIHDAGHVARWSILDDVNFIERQASGRGNYLSVASTLGFTSLSREYGEFHKFTLENSNSIQHIMYISYPIDGQNVFYAITLDRGECRVHRFSLNSHEIQNYCPSIPFSIKSDSISIPRMVTMDAVVAVAIVDFDGNPVRAVVYNPQFGSDRVQDLGSTIVAMFEVEGRI